METNKDLTVFKIDELIKSTYHKIATWHNDDRTQPGLKQLTLELIEDISGATFKHLDIPFNKIDILKDKETEEKIKEIKEEAKRLKNDSITS